MNKYIYEAYEDNAGGLHIFALNGTNDETVMWGEYYYGDECEAAATWVALTVREVDPTSEHWGTKDFVAAIDHKYCREQDSIKLIARIESNKLNDQSLGIDIDVLCSAGKNFAIECGVLYQCPKCGEIGECELQKPEYCEYCDAALD